MRIPHILCCLAFYFCACASAGPPASSRIASVQARSAAAHEELSCAETGGGKGECRPPSPRHEDELRQDQIQDIDSIKREERLKEELAAARERIPSSPPEWIFLPIHHHLFSDPACANEPYSGILQGDHGWCDAYRQSIVYSIIPPLWIVAIFDPLFPIDLVSAPFAVFYDAFRSAGYHIRRAAGAHEARQWGKRLEEFAPTYTAALKAQKRRERKRYQLGEIRWLPESSWRDQFPDFTPPAAEGLGLSAGKSAWKNFSIAASKLFQRDFDRFIGEKPVPPPPPPVLKQGKYEDRAAFNARLKRAADRHNADVQKYNAQVRDYNGRGRAYRLSDSRRTRILQEAFLTVFGSPAVSRTRYNPDTRAYSLELVSNSPYAKDFRQWFVLKENILPDAARGLDEDFGGRKALPAPISDEIVFQRAGDRLRVVRADFSVPGATGFVSLEAVPSQDAPETQLARVDLSHLEKIALSVPAPAKKISVDYTGARAGYHSDVDEPGLPAKIPVRPRDFALVFGVESYQDKALPPAEFAARDARAVARYLRALGVPESHVILRTNQEATIGALKGYLESWLPKNARADSRIYFYFSGHGAPDPVSGTAYLLPWDGDPGFLNKTAESVADVYRVLGGLQSKNILVAMDACFSGAGGRSVIEKGARPLVTRISAGRIPDNVTALTAARGDQIAQSLESQGHGMFTYYFLKGLDDGRKDAHSLCAFLKPEVRDAAALLNQNQNPVCHGPDFRFW